MLYLPASRVRPYSRTLRALSCPEPYLQRLQANGVDVHSYTEEYLATDNELVRNILLAVMASLAKVEAQRISERTKAGLARARAHGKKLGRPALPDSKRVKVERLHQADPKRSIRSIAKAAGVAYETARAHLARQTSRKDVRHPS